MRARTLSRPRGGRATVIALLSALVFVLGACSGEAPAPPAAPVATLNRYLAKYSPYEMSFDASGLPEGEKRLLQKLVEAAAYIDTAFRMQSSRAGLRYRDSIAALPADSVRAKLLALLQRNGGPYEMLHGDSAFLGTGVAPPGGEMYPHGLTVERFEDFVGRLSPSLRDSFLSPYTVVREDGSGGYRAVPYHREYARWIGPAAALLEEAASLSPDSGFGRFLRLKAEALRTDRYFDADTTWVGLSGNRYDLIFGPDEVYADGIRGIKASYQAYVEVVDVEESKRLGLYVRYLEAMERNLPVGDEYKSPAAGTTARFVVVTDIARSGEGAVGYQAVATNLPNDPEVHARKGTKKTFWKNMLKARFNAIIRPVSLRLLHPEQLQYLTSEGFFQFVLMHEICHALGPRVVKTGPKKGTSVNQALGTEYSALEEAKADLAGLHSLAWLIDKKIVERSREREFYASYLGALFRTIRFGIEEAHGKAAAAELGYLADAGAIMYDPAVKRWSVSFAKIRKGIERLTREFIVLEGDGDPAAVRAFFAKWAVRSPALDASLAATADVPVDVFPHYSVRWE